MIACYLPRNSSTSAVQNLFRRVEGVQEDGEDGGMDHDVEEGGVQPDKTNSRWLEMQKPRGSRPGLRETINLPLLRS